MRWNIGSTILSYVDKDIKKVISSSHCDIYVIWIIDFELNFMMKYVNGINYS